MKSLLDTLESLFDNNIVKMKSPIAALRGVVEG